ncbi:MAG TPA: hypothetical protein VF266_15720, partial [Thermoanaerobaculia bacterium]
MSRLERLMHVATKYSRRIRSAGVPPAAVAASRAATPGRAGERGKYPPPLPPGGETPPGQPAGRR